MSRLYDRLMASGGRAFPKALESSGVWGQMLTARVWDALQTATVVDFTDVARHFLTVEEREEWDCCDDFPGVTLPLSPGFYEFKSPGYSYSRETGRVEYGMHAVGYLGTMGPFDDELVSSIGALGWSGRNLEWIVETVLVVEFTKGNPRVAALHYWPLDSAGRMVRDSDDVLLATIPLAAIGREKQMQDQYSEELSPAKYPYLFGLSMLNCNNTTLEPVSPPPKLSKRHERKTGRPLTRYYTLEVEPMRPARHQKGGGDGTSPRKALHVCRGHFATYTPERPRFGRDVGTFWISQHVRGSKDSGEVAKDYSVSLGGRQ